MRDVAQSVEGAAWGAHSPCPAEPAAAPPLPTARLHALGQNFGNIGWVAGDSSEPGPPVSDVLGSQRGLWPPPPMKAQLPQLLSHLWATFWKNKFTIFAWGEAQGVRDRILLCPSHVALMQLSPSEGPPAHGSPHFRKNANK